MAWATRDSSQVLPFLAGQGGSAATLLPGLPPLRSPSSLASVSATVPAVRRPPYHRPRRPPFAPSTPTALHAGHPPRRPRPSSPCPFTQGLIWLSARAGDWPCGSQKRSRSTTTVGSSVEFSYKVTITALE
ncbi:hypothetical protein PVAP13_1NG114944 [Panicum virgatum]|uniref:Uncharacterized protein n=1 Tax=Panicum virgatum TaxID=38727 RepID=A0A8T0X1A9_PANVG|nr:hypothetical protein PVAP13_1NG114944 [Panicum virgatum]